MSVYGNGLFMLFHVHSLYVFYDWRTSSVACLKFSMSPKKIFLFALLAPPLWSFSMTRLACVKTNVIFIWYKISLLFYKLLMHLYFFYYMGLRLFWFSLVHLSKYNNLRFKIIGLVHNMKTFCRQIFDGNYRYMFLLVVK